MDVSKIAWFVDGSYAHLHIVVDHAINEVLALYFTKKETKEAPNTLFFQMGCSSKLGVYNKRRV